MATNDKDGRLGDEIAGRAKEAWGKVTGDEQLAEEGRRQHTADDGDAGAGRDVGAEGMDSGADRAFSDDLDAGADHGADGRHIPGSHLDAGADHGADGGPGREGTLDTDYGVSPDGTYDADVIDPDRLGMDADVTRPGTESVDDVRRGVDQQRRTMGGGATAI